MVKKSKKNKQSIRFTTNWTIEENKQLEKEKKARNKKSKSELVREITLQVLSAN